MIGLRFGIADMLKAVTLLSAGLGCIALSLRGEGAHVAPIILLAPPLFGGAYGAIQKRILHGAILGAVLSGVIVAALQVIVDPPWPF